MTTQKHTARKASPKRSPSAPTTAAMKRKGAGAKSHKVVAKPNTRNGQFAQVQKILIGSKKRKASNAVELIREGLPLDSIERVQTSLAFADEQPILDLLGMSKRTYQRRQRDGKPLGPVESDRLYRLAKIEARAAAVFNNDAIAIDWLRTQNRALGDEPINLLDTEAGTDMVERALTRIEHGVFA